MSVRALVCLCLLACCPCLVMHGSPLITAVNAATTESFEGSESPPGWMLTGAATIAADRSGKVLLLNGRGSGEWPQAKAQDFTLNFRYRHANGAGDVVLQSNGEPPDQQEYHIRFAGSMAYIIRRAGGEPKGLAKGDLALQPGKWYDMQISVQGGDIRVSCGGAQVAVTDPQPLPPGLITFGCIEGSGFAYDDISFTPGKSAVGEAKPVLQTVETVPGPPSNTQDGKKPGPPIATPIQLPNIPEGSQVDGKKPGPPAVGGDTQLKTGPATQGASKSDVRKQLAKQPLLSLAAENPVIPILMNTIGRYLSGASDPTQVDTLFREVLQRHPEMTQQRLQELLDAWNALPAADQMKITPPELRDLVSGGKLDSAALSAVLAGIMERQGVAAIVKSAIPNILASGQLGKVAVDLVASAIYNPQQKYRYVPGLGPVPVAAPASPRIDKLLPAPIETQGLCQVNPGDTLTVVCSPLPTEDWNLNICKVHFYPQDSLSPAASVSPYSAAPDRILVRTPGLAEGKYDIDVEMRYVSGSVRSSRARLYVAKVLNTVAPVLKSIEPASQFPGKTVTITGDKFTQNPEVYATLEPVEKGYETPRPVTRFLGTDKLELLLPQDARPGTYRLTLSSGGSPQSSALELMIKAPRYKVEFIEMKCDDESNPENTGDDEVMTCWTVCADGRIWTKNTATYEDFSDGVVKSYSPKDACAYAVDGSMQPVSMLLAINTQLLEIDANYSEEGTDYVGMVSDFTDALRVMPGVGDLIGGFVDGVVMATGWIMDLLGGAPDNLGRDVQSWTYADLQKKTNNPQNEFGGKIAFTNSDDTGSYTLTYRVTREDKP